MGNGAILQHDPLDITKKDCEETIGQIDATIEFHKNEIKKLTAQRNKLLVKIKYLDIDQVLEYIISVGLSANEVLAMINKALDERKHESTQQISQ